MRHTQFLLQGLTLSLLLLSVVPVWSQQHRATRLGNPATRFADPLHTPEDLRARFRDTKLWPDIASILRQAGWAGDMDDLLEAASSADITKIQIEPGTIMPFMSSRKNGRPIALKEVLWAGSEPTPAYAFFLSSKGRQYRCVTPKACSNFFLEDLGAPNFLLQCDAPDEVLAGRPVMMCLTLRNQGDGEEPNPVVTIPMAREATVTRIAKGGVIEDGTVSWELPSLPPQGEARVCVEFVQEQPGLLQASWEAKGTFAARAESQCDTHVVGIPAILLELVDLEDPIEVGETVTYRVNVFNQGTAEGTNIRITATLPEGQGFVSADGATGARSVGRIVTMEPLPILAPKSEASWTIVVKPLIAGDMRFQIDLGSDQLNRPVIETEATLQY